MHFCGKLQQSVRIAETVEHAQTNHTPDLMHNTPHSQHVVCAPINKETQHFQQKEKQTGCKLQIQLGCPAFVFQSDHQGL